MLDSVRTKLTFWYVGVLALVLLAFSFGVRALLERNLNLRMDAGMRSALESMQHALRVELAEGETEEEAAISTVSELLYPNLVMAVFDAGGRLLAESAAPGGGASSLPVSSSAVSETVAFFTLSSEKAGEKAGERTGGDPDWRVATQRTRAAPDAGSFIIVVKQSLKTIANELELLRQALYLAVPLALALAGGGGWLLARKSLAPVVAMSEQARRISAENLEDRLSIANPRDELGRLAATFNELLARLNSSFDQQRQFMADASHELRTPLSVMHTTAEVTLEQPHRDEAEYRDALAMIDAQTRRLARIVEEMLTLARADAGRRPLNPSDFYLDELIAETAAAAAVLAARKGVSIETGETTDAPYRGDEGLLRQMLLNLLDNGIKHTPPGGSVRVHLSRRDSAYEVTVADTGAGIPVEAQPRIFERFYRVDAARSRSEIADGNGAGLGLSIARWVAEAHRGSLVLERSDGAGSAFLIKLPL